MHRSKGYYIFIIFLFLFVIFSLCFAGISLRGGAGINIGSFFPLIFSVMILAVTLNLEKLKAILKSFYKPLILLFYTGCAFFVIAFAVFFTLILGYISEEILNADDVDLVIILGCQTHGYRPSKALKSRLDTAIEILNKYSNANCITAGGQGPDETIPEAEAMQQYLVTNGIDESRIFKEAHSSSTYENLTYSKEVIDQHGISYNHVVIVTNEYHVPRAAMIAKRIGFNVYTAKAPSPNDMFGAGIMREFFAFFKSLVFDTVAD